MQRQTWSMKPSQALEGKREAVRALVARYPTANPRLFGSALHGDDRDDSDIDILVDALPGATLMDLNGLQAALQALLGVPVDVRTPAELHKFFRADVLSEARPI
jgi:predicted nucleotidyltransferase